MDALSSIKNQILVMSGAKENIGQTSIKANWTPLLALGTVIAGLVYVSRHKSGILGDLIPGAGPWRITGVKADGTAHLYYENEIYGKLNFLVLPKEEYQKIRENLPDGFRVGDVFEGMRKGKQKIIISVVSDSGDVNAYIFSPSFAGGKMKGIYIEESNQSLQEDLGKEFNNYTPAIKSAEKWFENNRNKKIRSGWIVTETTKGYKINKFRSQSDYVKMVDDQSKTIIANEDDFDSFRRGEPKQRLLKSILYRKRDRLGEEYKDEDKENFICETCKKETKDFYKYFDNYDEQEICESCFNKRFAEAVKKKEYKWFENNYNFSDYPKSFWKKIGAFKDRLGDTNGSKNITDLVINAATRMSSYTGAVNTGRLWLTKRKTGGEQGGWIVYKLPAYKNVTWFLEVYDDKTRYTMREEMLFNQHIRFWHGNNFSR